MSSTRARRLEKLAMSFPQENQRLAQGQQAARQVQLQEQIRSARPGLGPGAAQQLGAQQAARAGQIQLGAQQTGQQQAQLVGQMGLEEQARGQRQRGFEQQIALTQKQRAAADRLSRIDRDIKNQLLDQQLQFRRDRAGQELLNERQLADWALSKAQSAEDYAEYAQAAQQVYQREIQMMDRANKVLTQALQQGQTRDGKILNQNLRKELIQQKRALEHQIQRKQQEAANKAAMFQAGGSILGTAVGAAFGGASGAAIGGSIGQGVGTAAGGLASS